MGSGKWYSRSVPSFSEFTAQTLYDALMHMNVWLQLWNLGGMLSVHKIGQIAEFVDFVLLNYTVVAWDWAQWLGKFFF